MCIPDNLPVSCFASPLVLLDLLASLLLYVLTLSVPLILFSLRLLDSPSPVLLRLFVTSLALFCRHQFPSRRFHLALLSLLFCFSSRAPHLDVLRVSFPHYYNLGFYSLLVFWFGPYTSTFNSSLYASTSNISRFSPYYLYILYCVN